MSLDPDAQEHPEAFRDCMDIGDRIRQFRAVEHGHALSSFVVAFESLFTGPGNPAWIGAAASLDDFSSHVAGTSNPKFFLEPFYGNGDEGMVACFGETLAGRPVLLSVVAFNGPGPGDPRTEAAALVRALRLAKRRAADL